MIFRKRSCQDQGISNSDQYHNKYLDKLLFHGNIGIICESAEGVDGGMDDNAGEQASTAIKNGDKQETYCNRKANLTQIVYQLHTAPVE